VSASRIGILGGSFDPAHLGHLHVARAAHDELLLDEVRLLPAHRPPHKPARLLASDEHRAAMVERLARLEPWLRVDLRELRRSGTSYTYDTLVEMRREPTAAAAELFFLIGSDSLADFPDWRRADELVGLATFVTVPRDAASLALARANVSARLGPAAAARLLAHVLPVEPLSISSSQVRALVLAGRPIVDFVPRSIAEYIAEHRLYCEPA